MAKPVASVTDAWFGRRCNPDTCWCGEGIRSQTLASSVMALGACVRKSTVATWRLLTGWDA